MRISALVLAGLAPLAVFGPACGSSYDGQNEGGVADASVILESGAGPTPEGASPTDAKSGGHDPHRDAQTQHEKPAPAAPFVFAVTGDTRPAIPDDPSGYPTDIIQTIYKDIAARTPSVDFVVGTGDYQFSDPFVGDASSQMALYMDARKAYPGPFYPAIGNHECTSLTNSNCGPGTSDGETVPYKAFLSDMLAPTGETVPYYVVHKSASDGSWTMKLVFIAGNAWTDAQGTWLDSAMAEKTTYTFVVRHEPASTTSAPGVRPSEAIIAKYPYTLALVGHTHTFEKSGPKEVIVGNGGAPLSGNVNYGYGLVTQRTDGTVLVEMIDYQSGASSIPFALTASGGSAPI